jgi:hypothetical protein
VGAGLDRRGAVAAVAGLRLDGLAVDLEVEAAGVRGREQLLLDGDLAGLALVRERAGDVLATPTLMATLRCASAVVAEPTFALYGDAATVQSIALSS